MPVSSAEISQMAMMNLQQMQQMQQLSNFGAPQAFGRPDMIGGAVLNTAASGASLGGGALGMLGMDPLGAGIGAGMAAFGSMGLAGAAGVGGAAFLGAGAVYAGANYVGGQMMEGAQQQQQLNSTLQQSFNFRNQYGGRGFTRSQGQQIGGQIRSMTQDVGQFGEMASFQELTNIAGKMGQMGMARGVRDVEEFGQKFRELVKTVKTVATTLNTSLDQAMEFMQQSKASGIFKHSDQLQFAQQMNATALGSNLSNAEVASAANMGSQISRAFGGLGKQGAMGGMRAIGQVGAAMQTGALSEEDIYNATGLTGAEGRQQLASNMMQQTGRFLKSGKGRYFLASLAGENGQIDEATAEDYMMGTMGVGDTRRGAGRMKRNVGRANFIRNEGRLRGAVMERFGAMAPTMALMGWARQRGVDINDMDDRSMLFAQRHLGMGRDEMDAAVKMAQDMPNIMREQFQQRESAEIGGEREAFMKTRGVEGAKRRFTQAKERLNNKLKGVGQDMYNEITGQVDAWLNKALDNTINVASQNLDRAYQESLKGGAGGEQMRTALFGGGEVSKAVSTLGLNQDYGMKGMTWDEFSGAKDLEPSAGSILMPGKAAAKAGMTLLGGGGAYQQRLKESGFYFDDIKRLGEGDTRNNALRTRLSQIDRLKTSLGGQKVSELTMTEEQKDTVARMYSDTNLTSLKGQRRVDRMGELLRKGKESGDAGAASLLAEWESAGGERNQYLMAMKMEQSIGRGKDGVTDLAQDLENIGDMRGALLSRGKWGNEQERDLAYGKAMTGRGRTGIMDAIGRDASNPFRGFATGMGEKYGVGGAIGAGALTGAGVGATLGMGAMSVPLGLAGAVVGAGRGAYEYYKEGGINDQNKMSAAAGAALRKPEMMRLAEGVLGGDEKSVRAARLMLGQNRGRDVGEGGEKALTAANILSSAELMTEVKKAGGLEKIDEETKKRLMEQHRARVSGMKGVDASKFEDPAAYMAAMGGTLSAVDETQRADVMKQVEDETKRSRMRVKGMTDYGTMKDGKIKALDPESGSKLSEAARAAVERTQGIMDIRQKLASADTFEEKATLTAQLREAEAGHTAALYGAGEEGGKPMGIQDLLAAAKATKGSGMDVQFAALAGSAQRLKSLSKRGGASVGVARYLGAGQSKAEQRKLRAAAGKGEEEWMEEMADQLNLSGDARTQFMTNKDMKGVYEKSGKSGRLGDKDSVEVTKAIEKMLAEKPEGKDKSQLAEQLEKNRYDRSSPQDKMVTNLEQLVKGLDPAKLGASIGEGLNGKSIKVSNLNEITSKL